MFNAYSPVTSAPGPVDVYLDPVIDATSHPALTVPYGTMSPLFDPTVVDDAGDTSLTFLPAGVTDQGKVLMTQQETVKSGDVITIYLTTGDRLDSGAYGGLDQVFFNAPSADLGLATAPPGKGLLIVVSSGLDQTLSSPEARDWYVSLGRGCDPGLDGGDSTTVTVSPGSSGASFGLDPGNVTVTIHAISPDSLPDCSGSPIASASVTAKPGVTDVLFLYGKDGDLHAEMVPLE